MRLVPCLGAVRAALVAFLAAFLSAALTAAQTLPPGFVAEPIGSGWNRPVALTFLDSERLLVAERAGRVWYVVAGERRNLVHDLARETLSNGDRGMLGMAVAPDFDLTGWLYLLFVVDSGARPDEAGTGFARLIRVRTELTSSGELVALPETREVLLGDTWSTGIPSCHLSHTVGSLRFLSDGSLVLASGDNAHYDFVDTGGTDPNCFAPGRTPIDQDLGAFRSQYDRTLCGKVLRLDPTTGLGLPDNPFFTGNPAALLSREWARGLRNPFRFTLVPGTGPREALFVADVGWNAWEEVELCLGGENFGWPCFEGRGPQPAYRAVDTFGICDGVAVAHAPPVLAWHHSQTSAGFSGNCASGLCVYRGQRYPEVYRGRLFFSDFGQGWLRAAELDEHLRATGVLTFATGLGGPVDLVEQPGTLDLAYAALPATVARLRYVGAGLPPVAVASATPAFGAGSLEVVLDGSGSRDPEGQELAFTWDLGDGSSAEGAHVVHTYAGDASFVARLTVTDSEGLSAAAEVRITPNDTPPVIHTLAPGAGALFERGEPLALVATATDAEDADTLAATWTLDLVHDHHVHPEWATAEGFATRVVPDAHGPGDNHFVVRLAVRDPRGLADERAFPIYDAHSRPRAHWVEQPGGTLRVGQRLAGRAHVDWALGQVSAKQATLRVEWGDGAVESFPEARHHADVELAHAYARPGSYRLRLVAALDGVEDVRESVLEVGPARPAVAVFAPLEAERWIPRAEQEAIVAGLRAALGARASEVRAFELGAGAELARWMESLTDDGLTDVLVLLDFVPAALIAGGVNGSPLARWLAGGNGVVWSGATPLQEVLADDGSATQTVFAADELFGATAPLVVHGAGAQVPTELGARVLPSLPLFVSARALRAARLGPPWRVARVFAAEEGGELESDAIELTLGARGFYAQFLCVDAPDLPRAAVLSEYLTERFAGARHGVVPAGTRRR
jgi:glucose/arabinose dehydrogenase